VTEAVRLDKWLWAVRVYRTRTQAAEACRAGQVRINGQTVRPSRDVRVGDTLTARGERITRTVRVRALLENRISAAQVAEFLEDLTPPEERSRPSEPDFRVPAWRPAGAGRPTKRERRQMNEWLERSGGEDSGR
jgi:ribosome-associated heat shock protein Hsp15